MASFMVSTYLQPPFASYEKGEGVKDYACKTLEGKRMPKMSSPDQAEA